MLQVYQTALILVNVAAYLVSGERSIGRELSGPLRTGDVVEIHGRGYGRIPGRIRFFDSKATCHGRVNAVNPLSLAFSSRKRRIAILKKTESTNCVDKRSASIPKFVPEISIGRQYTISVEVASDEYVVKVGRGDTLRLLYRASRNRSESVDLIKAYSGNYTSIIVKRYLLSRIEHCGRLLQHPPLPTALIIERLDAYAGEFPWQASIHLKQGFRRSPTSHLCSGTLIHHCWVLTVGHCAERIKKSMTDYSVRLGNLENLGPHDTASLGVNQQDFDIANVFVHKSYRLFRGVPVNDIALIQLKQNNGRCAINTSYVRPACLPDIDGHDSPASRECEVSGWGSFFFLIRNRLLQRRDARLLSPRQCRGQPGHYGGGHSFVQDGMICARSEPPDSFIGDSGSALVCLRNGTDLSASPVISGITSWGNMETPVLDVYTDIKAYLPWINTVIFHG